MENDYNKCIHNFVNGYNFMFSKINNNVVYCNGCFYNKGDTWQAEYKNLTKYFENINCISIRNPIITELSGSDLDVFIEYFKSITILENKIIIEI